MLILRGKAFVRKSNTIGNRSVRLVGSIFRIIRH